MRCPLSRPVSGAVGTGVQTVCFGDQVQHPDLMPPPREGEHRSGLCNAAQGSRLWGKVGQDEYLPTRQHSTRVSCSFQGIRQVW